MIKHFVPYEPKLVARNGKDDPLVIEDYYNMYMNGMRQKVSVACYKENSNEFVAVNVLEVLGRNDPLFNFQVRYFMRQIINCYMQLHSFYCYCVCRQSPRHAPT
jgi:hypothetical protein